MDLYIKKKYKVNFKEDKTKISSTNDIIYSISTQDEYQMEFIDSFNYDGLVAGKKYKLKLYYNYFDYGGLTSYIKDFISGDILDTVITSDLNGPIEFNFIAQSSKIIIINSSSSFTYLLLAMEILDTEVNLLTTESDFNIVYDLVDAKDLTSLTMPYSKSIKIYKNEFNKKLFLELSNPRYKYEAQVFRNSLLILSGDLVIKNFTDDNYYDCIIQTNVSLIKELSDINISEYLTEEVEYSYSNYESFLDDPDNYNYGYYNTYETYNPDSNWNPFNSDNRIDFTFVNTQYVQEHYTHTGITDYWNWNTYIRLGVKYHNLFDLAHRLNGWNYVLDADVEESIKDLTITNPFFKEYEENEEEVTVEPNFVRNSNVQDGVPEILINELIMPGTSLINSNGIIDFHTSGDPDDSSVTGLEITLEAIGWSTGDAITLKVSLGLYTLDSVGNIDLLLEETSATVGVSFSEQTRVLTTNWDLKYHYAEYGYGIKLLLEVIAPSLSADRLLRTSINKPFTTTITKKYVIYTEGENIPLKDLIPSDLTFLDVVKNVTKMYNLYSVVDYEKAIITYKRFEDYFIEEPVILSNKFDNTNVKLDYYDFNTKIKYTYNEPSSNELYYDNIKYTNVSSNSDSSVDIKANVLYDNVYENWLFSADFMEFYPYSSYDEPTVNGFDPLVRVNPRSDYGIGFVNVVDSTTLSTCADWNLTDLGFTKIPMIGSIDINNDYGVWWNKDEFDKGSVVYKYLKYSDIDNYTSLYKHSYFDYDNHIYNYGAETFTSDFYLTNQEIKKLLNHHLVIIDNQRYIVSNMTISNKKVNLELIKYI